MSDGSAVTTDLASRASRTLKVREMSLEDYPQIAQLQSRYDLKVKNSEEWRHLWLDNPIYRKFQTEWPIGWVLENEDKQILGSIENIPLQYELLGKKIAVSTGRNWVVDSHYRSYSILLLDHYFSQQNSDLFIMGGATIEAFRAYMEFHLSPVPSGDWDQSSYWVTNYPGFVKSALIKKAVPLANFLSYPLSIPLFCMDRFRKSLWRLYRSNVGVQPCTHFDERFDGFWEALKTKRSHILLGLRSREMLEWHFKYALLRNKAWIVTITEGSSLAAYSIFDRNDNRKLGLKRTILVDFQTLNGDNSLLIPMLAWALQRCRDEGIHLLDVRGFCPGKRGMIEQFAPHRRKLSWWLYVYKARDKTLQESLRNPDVWDPSFFDADPTL